MRNMLALFGAALLTVVGVGWYLGWYKVRSQPASLPGQHSLNIDINTNKITKDLQQGEQRLQQMLEKKGGDEAKNAIGGLTLPSPEAPSNSQVKSTSKSLFQFHSDKGSSFEANTHPLLQLSGGDKK